MRYEAQLAFFIIIALAFPACAAQVEPKVTPAGDAKTMKKSALEMGAHALQTHEPIEQFGVYLVGFHAYKHDPAQQMTAHHFCRPINEDLAQCVLFDSNTAQANLNGIEYIISEKLYEQLPPAERPYWHPHNHEILSGTLIAPGLADAAEHAFLKMFMNSYGKTWHTWRTGMFGLPQDWLPLGDPHLAWSFNHEGEAKAGLIEKRDQEMQMNSAEKHRQRQDFVNLAHPQEGVNAISTQFPGPIRSIPGVIDKSSQPGNDQGHGK